MFNKLFNMSRISKLQNQTTMCAHHSNQRIRVGAMIVKGSKIYARGYNNNTRTTFLNMKDCSQHAEMAAATQFINSVVKKNPKKYRFLWEKGKKWREKTFI